MIAGWYPSDVLPTNGDFVQRHAEALALQHHVTVIHIINDPVQKENIRITDTIQSGVRTLIAYIRPGRMKLFRYYHAYRKLMVLAGKHDLIHVQILYPAGLIALWRYIRYGTTYLITEHHSIYTEVNRALIGKMRKRLSRIISRNAAYICPVSEFLAGSMRETGLPGTYHVVPNVVNTDIFFPGNVRTAPSSAFNLLHVSNMNGAKNPLETIRIIKKCISRTGNIKIYLIGMNEGRLDNFLEREHLPADKIVHIPHVPQARLADYYRKADVVLLFSKVETQGLAVLESFACGTPVVASKVGGIPEHFPAGFGYLIPPDNPDGAVESIVQLSQTGFPEGRKKEMYEYVKKRFSPQAVNNRFTALYLKMLERS